MSTIVKWDLITINEKKEVMSLKENKEGHMLEFVGKKGLGV